MYKELDYIIIVIILVNNMLIIHNETYAIMKVKYIFIVSFKFHIFNSLAILPIV